MAKVNKRTKIRLSARGEECLVRIPGHCNFNPETVVLGHIGGAGMGFKAKDFEAAYTCSGCHDAIDGRVKSEYTKQQLELMHLQGCIRTREILFQKGLILVA